MFENCPLMERLDLSNFDTHNVMEMVSMFEGCISLKELDISSFDTGNVFEKADGTEEEFSGLLNMFQSCPSLENIHLGSTFSWYPDAGLPSGNWTNGSVTYTVGGLYDNWDASLAGVWSREITPVLHAVEYLAGLVKCQALD
ncbi:MAG: BspA family leucine-rich repeat surface protein [Erysipelotrichaceae bacterium]|nr:BspA family leucine-rich repeat surface protein [Erysipelotrichaceae bacterium]